MTGESMSDYKVGFIGGGNMSYAVAMGLVKGGFVPPKQVLVSNRTASPKLAAFETAGMRVTLDNIEVLSLCRVVFLGVKPFVFPAVVDEIMKRAAHIDLTEIIFVSLMGGVSILDIQTALENGNLKVIRTLPNTPCLCLAGTILIAKNRNVTEEEYTMIKNALTVCAACYDIPEENFDAGSAVMGCSPAYFFMAIEALADGGVMHGVPRALAIELASRAVMGAGKLALESGKHTEELKDGVASPSGSTIRGIYALEKGGFRGTLIDAVHATCTPLKK